MKTALYYIRTRCNYSQSMVARELNVSRQIYSAWESGAKALPALRRSELANLFGIPEEILLECEEATVERFCDQPIFSRVCQGKQVFSFQPDRELRVFLGAPDSQRPAEHCAELMNSKKALLAFIDSALSFERGQEVEQLQDMEASVRLLQSFCSLLKLTKEIDPEYKKRLSEFILEQLNILGHALGVNEFVLSDDWHKQQEHIILCRWGALNRKSKRQVQAPSFTEENDDSSLYSYIKLWYEQAKLSGRSHSELQWQLNKILEQEYGNEKD